MESLWKSSNFTNADFNYFKFERDDAQCQPRSTRICVNSSDLGRTDWLTPTKGRSENDWTSWLNTVTPAGPVTDDHFALVISPRPTLPPGETIHDHSPLLKYLSISKSSFQSIVNKLHFHRAIVVLLDRGTPVISRIRCTVNNVECHVYTLRLDHALIHQTAMTITYFPKLAATGPQKPSSGSKTNAIILGYDDADITELQTTLRSSKETIFLPFTLIKAYLSVERKRRFGEVNHKIAQFQSILLNYGRLPLDEEEREKGNGGGNAQDPKNLIGLYISVCTLKNQLTAWKTQIAGFRSHVKDFESPCGQVDADIDPGEYLQRLVDEYGVKIDKCELVLQGASLAFQMTDEGDGAALQETAHLSRLDSQNALRDGKQMKAIALLTMFFLPGTFIATLLAVPQFEDIKKVTKLPEWSWYFVLFLPLTTVVIVAYLLWTNYYKSKAQKSLAHMV